ncbi:hypothetical protein EDB85DRAFT_2293531 [Lactarius pseudohatsudake]|nr:hypothetical protein EDB85DRAFT_2293531 [Lactarius pseudohatsudake]
MPSPRSKYAPYYSGCTDLFEDFLEQYEGLAYDCALTDPQRVDVLIRYVAPSLRDFWRSLNGYRSHNWPLFRQSLIDVFGNPTPRHQIMRQKLHSHVQETSRTRMHCKDDVLRYYRQFICFGLPLVHAGHLSEEERNTAFWYGFHPEDREVLQPRLLGKNPSQPPDVPFHFEDVLSCARAAFAYVDYFPLWSHAKQFQSPSVRREQPVVEPIPRDAYSFRAVTCAVATYAETTPELPPSSYSMPDSDLPLSSISLSESQYTQAPSVTLDQPEPAPTLSTTLRPSASFPTPYHASSLAPSAADIPEISSTHPLSSTAPTPSPTSSTCLPLVAEEQPKPETESIPSITPAFTFAPMPPSSSTFLPSPARSAMNNQPESEHEAASTSMSVPLSLPLSMLHPLSPLSSTFLPSPVTSATDDQPEHASTFSIPSSTSFHSASSLPSTSLLGSPVTDNVPEIKPAPPSLSLCPSDLPVPMNLAPSPSTSNSQLCFPASSELTPASLSKPLELDDVKLESSPALAPSDVVTLSHPESSLSSPGEPVPFLPASPEAPPIAHISPCSTPPQRLPEVKTISSVSTRLEVTPAPASLAIPFAPQSQELPMVNEVWSTLAPRFPLTSPPLTLSRSGLARFNFSLVLITTTVLVSTLFNASTTLSILAHKYWNKNEDFGNIQIGTLNTSSRDVFAQRLRLGHPTPRGTHFVFDPGGQPSSSRLCGTRRRSQAQVEDIQRLLRHARRHPYSHSSRQSHCFDPGGGAFVLEPAHEDSATFDKDVR